MEMIRINTGAPQPSTCSILIIYTGGTIGMIYDPSGQHLIPFDFEEILSKVPELRQFEYELVVHSLPNIVDSSDMKPQAWIYIAQLIAKNYAEFDGFVILHGTDTMAYTASALSFLLEGLTKPVILTGSQLPIHSVRTDAYRNLVTSLQIVAEKKNGRALVPEVCIFFNDVLLRGNRAKKVESSYFNAYHSENYPPLAKVGIHIDYNPNRILPCPPGYALKVHQQMEEEVVILQIFPGMNEKVIRCILAGGYLKGIVLETYGSGTAPSDPWFIKALTEAIDQGVKILNVSQCIGGKVEQGQYANSQNLEEVGVISGRDLTSEAAITKLMFLLAQDLSSEKLDKQLKSPLRGEMSI